MGNDFGFFVVSLNMRGSEVHIGIPERDPRKF